MALVPKYVDRAFSLLCFCFASCFFSATSFTQESRPAVPRADSKAAKNAEFLAAADEVLQQMSEITGLKLLTPLKKSLRSRDEIRAYVVKQMNEEKNPAERYA